MQNIQIIRSNRKTIAIQIKPDMTVVVRAPYRVPKKDILQFLEEKKNWIEKHLQKMQESNAERGEVQRLSPEEIEVLFQQALEYIPQRVVYYAQRIGVNYSRITIRNQKTRWGSCSTKGGLNFNCLLMKAPSQVIDYVVVHELCHRIEMNHSKKFWQEVENVLPDYQNARKWLKEQGNEWMRRMHG